MIQEDGRRVVVSDLQIEVLHIRPFEFKLRGFWCVAYRYPFSLDVGPGENKKNRPSCQHSLDVVNLFLGDDLLRPVAMCAMSH